MNGKSGELENFREKLPPPLFAGEDELVLVKSSGFLRPLPSLRVYYTVFTVDNWLLKERIEDHCPVVAVMSAPSSSHRPRKKKRQDPSLARTPTTADILTVDSQTNAVTPGFPLVAFLWPARGTTSQWILLPLVLLAVGLFRWTVGFWGYSGQ